MSSLEESMSNGTLSSPINISREIECGANIPTTKRKSKHDAWNMIKRIRNNDDLFIEHKGMKRFCLKCV